MLAIPAGDQTEMVAEYISSKVKGSTQFKPGLYQAFAFLTDSREFVGGVVVNNFRKGTFGNDCEASIAVETPMALRPHVLRAVYVYIFTQLQCVRTTAITTKKNRRARKLLEGMGFVLEGCVRHGYDGKRDALIYGLLAKDCRYL